MTAAAAPAPSASSPVTARPGRGALWTGRILSGLMAAFLFLDAGMKLVGERHAVEGTTKLGFPPGSLFWMGASLFAGTLLYVIPRTAILGAILVTGYLGGAVATNLFAKQPLFNLLFPVWLGVLTWLGLWLRDPALRALTPVRR